MTEITDISSLGFQCQTKNCDEPVNIEDIHYLVEEFPQGDVIELLVDRYVTTTVFCVSINDKIRYFTQENEANECAEKAEAEND